MIYNEIYVYDERANILMLTNKKHLPHYLKMGYKEIDEETAKSLPDFDKIKELLDQ